MQVDRINLKVASPSIQVARINLVASSNMQVARINLEVASSNMQVDRINLEKACRLLGST